MGRGSESDVLNLFFAVISGWGKMCYCVILQKNMYVRKMVEFLGCHYHTEERKMVVFQDYTIIQKVEK